MVTSPPAATSMVGSSVSGTVRTTHASAWRGGGDPRGNLAGERQRTRATSGHPGNWISRCGLGQPLWICLQTASDNAAYVLAHSVEEAWHLC